MSAGEDETSTHNVIENVDVNYQNQQNTEVNSDSCFAAFDATSKTLRASSDNGNSFAKSIKTDHNLLQYPPCSTEETRQKESFEITPESGSESSSPAECSVSTSSNELSPALHENSAKGTPISLDTKNSDRDLENSASLPEVNTFQDDSFLINSNLAISTTSLIEQNSNQNVICKSPFSRSAENISKLNKKTSLNSSDNDLDKETIISQFISHKNKVAAIQKIPDNTDMKLSTKIVDNTNNSDARYSRIPKEILSQDIGSIVKNVHGIFSSVSGTLKYAYNQRSVQKPIKSIKPMTNEKVMNDIFEDPTDVPCVEEQKNQIDPQPISENVISHIENDNSEAESDTKKDVLRLQVKTLERLLNEQRKENGILRERLKEQVDQLHAKDQTFKELEMKLDVMAKRVEQAERDKDAAVMRYASVECAAIEARRAADNAAKGEKAALAEVELLNNKLRTAHQEKQRIIQMYDDKCHEVQNCEREAAKVRDELRELEGRLKWTQSKLRMEMDAYKDSSERVEKLTQRVSELEAGKEAAAANAADSLKAKQFEAELKECRAALILCRHEKEELDKRYNTTMLQLETCRKDKEEACASLDTLTMEVEKLKLSNLRLEEEAAELAALRAKAALADTLSAQLQRESERALQAEEALSLERAAAETCARREAAALEHSARVTAQHVARRSLAERHEAQAQALAADNASLRERLTALEAECGSVRASLAEETERRHRENKVLARKVAELTEELSEANKKLEWEKGENGVIKKKHASAVRELNRELQRALKRCEQLEAKLPHPDAPSTRTGSISSLSSEGTPTEDRMQNGHDAIPDIQVREPDRQALIERIVSLQRAAARRAERCEFLEEHSKQLTNELRNKSRLLRHILSTMPTGSVVSEDRDMHKKEMARLGGGAMAAVWGGDRGGMTLELSLEMTARLQALLEDTLLKNITLKENIDTLGAEISRLKEQTNVETKSK